MPYLLTEKSKLLYLLFQNAANPRNMATTVHAIVATVQEIVLLYMDFATQQGARMAGLVNVVTPVSKYNIKNMIYVNYLYFSELDRNCTKNEPIGTDPKLDQKYWTHTSELK